MNENNYEEPKSINSQNSFFFTLSCDDKKRNFSMMQTFNVLYNKISVLHRRCVQNQFNRKCTFQVLDHTETIRIITRRKSLRAVKKRGKNIFFLISKSIIWPDLSGGDMKNLSTSNYSKSMIAWNKNTSNWLIECVWNFWKYLSININDLPQK